MKIRVAIAGYGNLGRGVESALLQNEDMEAVALFTRRDPNSITTRTGIPVYTMEQAAAMKDDIDVMILCGGSANDLPVQTPQMAALFNVVDSFDTHAKIPQHFDAVDAVSRQSGKVAVISAGWDPGLFSLNRLLGQAILPCGKDYTFWGRGVSQGHSDAIRRIPGVLDARQYTIPVEQALSQVRNGENPDLTTREKHTRECFVVAEDGADRTAIEQAIVTMPHYFADYDTTVHFITAQEMQDNHSGIPHGGEVFRCGTTGFNGEHKHVMEFKLSLDSNPEFTSSVLVAYARAAYRMNAEGQSGCKTVFDIAPCFLHPATPAEQRAALL